MSELVFLALSREFYIAFYTSAGPLVCGRSFPSACGAVVRSDADRLYVSARRGNFVLASTMDGTELRTYFSGDHAPALSPAIGGAVGVSFHDAYVFAAWASWIINLALVETWNAYQDRHARQAAVSQSGG